MFENRLTEKDTFSFEGKDISYLSTLAFVYHANQGSTRLNYS